MISRLSHPQYFKKFVGGINVVPASCIPSTIHPSIPVPQTPHRYSLDSRNKNTNLPHPPSPRPPPTPGFFLIAASRAVEKPHELLHSTQRHRRGSLCSSHPYTISDLERSKLHIQLRHREREREMLEHRLWVPRPIRLRNRLQRPLVQTKPAEQVVGPGKDASGAEEDCDL